MTMDSTLHPTRRNACTIGKAKQGLGRRRSSGDEEDRSRRLFSEEDNACLEQIIKYSPQLCLDEISLRLETIQEKRWGDSTIWRRLRHLG